MLRERNENLYKGFEEPEFDKEGKMIKKKLMKKQSMKKARGDGDDDEGFNTVTINLMDDDDMVDDLRKEMELPEGCLVTNLFIPMAVVCSKVDIIER